MIRNDFVPFNQDLFKDILFQKSKTIINLPFRFLAVGSHINKTLFHIKFGFQFIHYTRFTNAVALTLVV